MQEPVIDFELTKKFGDRFQAAPDARDNPALATGPFITTINALLGLTVYFFTVQFFLQ